MNDTEHPKQLIKEINQAQANKSNLLIFSYPALWLIISFMSNSLTMTVSYDWGVLLTLFGLSVYRSQHLKAVKTKSPQQWQKEFIILALLNGVIWSIPTSFYIFEEGLTTNSFIWILVTSGVSIGGAFSMTPIKHLAMAYNIIMMAPLSLALILSTQDQSTDSGICIAIFLLFTSKLVRNISDTFSSELTTRLNLEASRQAMKELSEKDPLTGIYNRGYWTKTFQREWQRACREKTPISLLMLDIDHFKQINDNFGHPTGDTCIKEISQIIQAHCNRATDTVARYGGEEFVVLLTNTPAEGATSVAKLINSKIEKSEYYDARGSAFNVTASIGVATTIPENNDLYDQLLIEADRMLYSAKENGRNQVVTA